jgi:hypothetical protein
MPHPSQWPQIQGWIDKKPHQMGKKLGCSAMFTLHAVRETHVTGVTAEGNRGPEASAFSLSFSPTGAIHCIVARDGIEARHND